MGNYYYLVAQLPAVSFSRDSKVNPPIAYGYFLDLCNRFLDGSVLEQVNKLSLEPPRQSEETGSVFLNRWYEWERDLRFAMAQLRAQKMNKIFSDSAVLSVTQDIQQIAKTACSYDSPLEAEQFLNMERIKKIDELVPTDPFNPDSVFAYGLKLKMAERMQKFDENVGKQSYHNIYDQILGDAK